MIEELPPFIAFLFTLTTLYAVWLFKKAFRPNQSTWLALFAWLAIQASLAYSGFYQDTTTLPPKFALAILPPFLFVLYLVYIKKGGGQSLENLHWIHTVRIPVEIVLWLLASYETIPKLMTFEGRNFDIIAGFTAPLIILYGLRKTIIDSQRVLLWNFIGLFLLANIVITAILSAPSPFQKLAFETPNVAVLTFPFVWLTSFIVPLVLFSHLMSIKQLMKK